MLQQILIQRVLLHLGCQGQDGLQCEFPDVCILIREAVGQGRVDLLLDNILYTDTHHKHVKFITIDTQLLTQDEW